MDDFGGKLRQARERRGISLQQIAATTRIAAAALEALERNDISKLPGGIFSRAFVRAYAGEVGLDPDGTVEEFLARFDQERAPTAQSIAAAVPEAEAAFENRRRLAAIVLTLAAISIPVLVLGGYLLFRGRFARDTHAVAHPPAAVAAPLAVAAAPAVAAPEPTPQSLTLEVHPRSACWVSLTVDGRRLFARVMQPGEREAHPVEREAVLEIGDAGAFAFAINGREAKPLGSKGQVKTLKVTPATMGQYLP